MAATLLELERQISGSQPEYFALREEVLALTRGGIDRQEALATSAGGQSSPFTGGAAGTAALDNLGSTIVDGVVQGVVSGLGYKTDITNENLGVLIMQGIAAQKPGSPLVGVANW